MNATSYNRTTGYLLTNRKISSRISNVMFNNQQELFNSHPFLMSLKFETKGCQWYQVKRIKSIYAYRQSWAPAAWK